MATKRYRVSWNEVYVCQSVVEAESESEAMEIATQNEPGQKEFGEMEDVNVEVDEDEED